MRQVTFLCVLIIVSSTAWAGNNVILLGMVEDVPGVYTGEPHSTKVRMLFSYEDHHWRAFKSSCENMACLAKVSSSFPKQVTWYVGLDGHQIGKVIAKTPKKFDFYAHIGLQDIIKGEAPVIGRASDEFSGYLGEPVHRPLVAVSKSNFNDPQHWKLYKISHAIFERVLILMHKYPPAACTDKNNESGPLYPYQYRSGDVDIQAHKSVDGSLLLNVSLNDAYYCKGGSGDGSYDTQMFAISPANKVNYLGPGLSFLDAGDYAGDDNTEIVMMLTRNNRGGYVLFSNSFVEEARFEFGYH